MNEITKYDFIYCRFNPLFIRGKMQAAKECRYVSRVCFAVSIPYSSGEKCKKLLTEEEKAEGYYAEQFQSLIHQGKNARMSEKYLSKVDILKFQSLIHQGKNARHPSSLRITEYAIQFRFNPLFIRGKMQA